MMLARTRARAPGSRRARRSPRATGATAPMWSKWQCVSRIASTVSTPSSSSAPSSAVGLVARDRRSARVGASLRRTMKQFSCTGPTVNMRTSITCAGARCFLRCRRRYMNMLGVVAAAGCRAASAKTAKNSGARDPVALASRDERQEDEISTAAIAPRVVERPARSAACSAARSRALLPGLSSSSLVG